MLEQEKEFTQKDHSRFIVKELLGVDVMPFAASIAASHLVLQSPDFFTNKVNVAIWDSTELTPGKGIPSLAKIKHVLLGQTELDTFFGNEKSNEITKGVVRMAKTAPYEIKLDFYNVVIMNPPFTRQERIPDEYKSLLLERFSKYEEYLHGQLGYHGYFALLADKFLEEGGRIAFVLPATVLRLKSFEGIRKFLKETYHVEYIITTLYRSAFSESSRFREILLVAKKGKLKNDAKTIIVTLKTLPKTLNEARDIAIILKRTVEDWEDENLIVSLIDFNKLEDTANWFRYISVIDRKLVDTFNDLVESEKINLLSSIIDIDEEIMRGFELEGGNVTRLIVNSSIERAIKTSDIWILEKDTKTKLKFRHKVVMADFEIPKNAVQRTIRRASGISKIDITDELDYVIIDKWEQYDDFQSVAGIKISKLDLERIKKAIENRIGNLHMVRRLDLSAPGTNGLTFFSSERCSPTKLFWSLNIPDECAKILALFFNSTINILQVLLSRSETRGAFVEISKYILQDFLTINPEKLSENEKGLLLNIFQEVKDVELPSILTQLKDKHPVRKKIDEAFLQILGKNIDLDIIYEKVANEIEVLKKLMSEGK